MKSAFLLAVWLAIGPTSLSADPLACFAPGCPAGFNLISVSDLGRYGVLIAAPDTGCRMVRFRVQLAGGDLLGLTPPLGPGELAVVRFGRQFAPGDHALTIAADGCDTRPAATRRVTLTKAGPDHGWRAAG
jgi:hypothetical protein